MPTSSLARRGPALSAAAGAWGVVLVALRCAPNTPATESDAVVRPFQVHVPDATLVDLRRRLAATRWPDRETVSDSSQGAQLEKLQKLVRYWGSGYEQVEKGGRFAAWEQPQLFSEELRAAFRSLRPAEGEAAR
jgi:epoxide hydrolase-like protein